ncbi:MAG TPA: glutathione S-transferase family protein [Polyangiaceae bacterium]|nr:glutathione S-transferase family protein [Polyangiaceae bacterium]
MSLKLYMHPFASFCQKVLIALYENSTPFVAHQVDLGDETSRAAFLSIWPVGQFPVLRDEEKGRTIPESTIIIEYLSQHYPGPVELVPAGRNLAIQTRLWDRFYDLHVDEPMQKIVTDRLRPAGRSDSFGVEHARKRLLTAYRILDGEMATRPWATGTAFSMADCAAAPALFYANLVEPFGDAHRSLAAYLQRLIERPSFARVVKEAQPYMAQFPR